MPGRQAKVAGYCRSELSGFDNRRVRMSQSSSEQLKVVFKQQRHANPIGDCAERGKGPSARPGEMAKIKGRELPFGAGFAIALEARSARRAVIHRYRQIMVAPGVKVQGCFEIGDECCRAAFGKCRHISAGGPIQPGNRRNLQLQQKILSPVDVQRDHLLRIPAQKVEDARARSGQTQYPSTPLQRGALDFPALNRRGATVVISPMPQRTSPVETDQSFTALIHLCSAAINSRQISTTNGVGTGYSGKTTVVDPLRITRSSRW